MAKIVAIANQKGGVGKTTTAVNLSSCVAALGKKTLIVDLDPQGNTTTGYGIPKRSVDVGTYELLIGEAEARDAIRKTEFRTDVIGSNTTGMRSLEYMSMLQVIIHFLYFCME